MANLEADHCASFEKQRRSTEASWEAYLSKLACPSDELEVQRIFYTALYHCAIHPSLYSDANGEYRGMDGQVHKALTSDGRAFERYTIFSLWDTFRGLHPLLCEIEPERTADFINSFISIYNECGKLPIWELWGNETNCMIGYNSAPVIADAVYRGIGGFSVEEAFEALLASSKNPAFGMDSFRRNGCVIADDEHESVSKTLEYAYDDWCVAQVAKYLGREAEYEEYMTSAQYWRNVFDPSTGFMRARLNGRWLSPFDPTEVNNHYTEANCWQYSFFVPQDIAGLADALGGRDALLERVDALFSASQQTSGRSQVDITGQIGQYAHGNEPSHHIAWIPELLGDREMTEKYVSQILGTGIGAGAGAGALGAGALYSSEPDGICGNDDCGQTSAWYVLSLLDRYPVCPGTELKSLTSMEKTIVRNPVFAMESDIFVDSLVVAVKDIEEGARAYVCVSGGGVSVGSDDAFVLYEGPITVTEPCTLKAYSVAADGRRSFTVSSTVHQTQKDIEVSVISDYDPLYNAGGESGLIDGYRGTTNWKAGGWMGVQGEDLVVFMDLLSNRHVDSLTLGFCQDARSWIWMPREVFVYAAQMPRRKGGDGFGWTLVGSAKNGVDPRDMTVQVQDLVVPVDCDAHYLKIVATQLGTIPSWHPGAGYQSYIFIDEIHVK